MELKARQRSHESTCGKMPAICVENSSRQTEDSRNIVVIFDTNDTRLEHGGRLFNKMVLQLGLIPMPEAEKSLIFNGTVKRSA